MIKVFLSHSSIDKPQVRILAKLLNEAPGIEPWLDEWNLIPGQPWQEGIEQALSDCEVCLCLIGKQALGPWQHEEMRAAIAKRVEAQKGEFRVIPVLLPAGRRGERSKLPSFLSRSTWVTFRESFAEEDNFYRLICGIKGIPPKPKKARVIDASHCPFPGLRFFDIEQSDYFFGREAEAQWLINKLDPDSQHQANNRFCAIIGPSGSGKTSLVRAGLLSDLQKGALERSERWPQVVFYPGDSPLDNLSFALSKSGILPALAQDVQQFQAELLKSKRTLYTQGRLFSKQQKSKTDIVLFIDQFEELFTLCKEETEREAFINNLCYAATHPQSNWVVLLTLRSDFIGKCTNYHLLRALISDHQFLVGPMGTEELKMVIQQPAQLSGLSLDAGLLEKLLEESTTEPNSLPLLQYTLMELWKGRANSTLSYQTYQQLGGIAGSLDQRASEVFASLSETEKEGCRHLFLRMVQPGEGTEDTKRRVNKTELTSPAAAGKSLESLIQKLSSPAVRLLTTDNDYVEITHEALIQKWGLLRGWIEEERDNLKINRRLTQNTLEWKQSGENADFLYAGTRLAQIEEWSQEASIILNEDEKRFVAESIQKRRNKKKRTIGIYLGVVAIAVLVSFLFYQNQQTNFISQSQAQTFREIARAYTEKDRVVAARIAESTYLETPDNEVAQITYKALTHDTSITTYKGQYHFDTPLLSRIQIDNKEQMHLLIGSYYQVRKYTTGELVDSVKLNCCVPIKGYPTDISLDKKFAVFVEEDESLQRNTVVLTNLRTKKQVRTYKATNDNTYPRINLMHARLTEDNQYIVAYEQEGRIYIWSVAGELLRTIKNPSQDALYWTPPMYYDFSIKQNKIAAWNDKTDHQGRSTTQMHVWDFQGQLDTTFTVKDRLFTVLVAKDQPYIFFGGAKGIVYRYDYDTRSLVTLPTTERLTTHIHLLPSKRLLVGYSNGSISEYSLDGVLQKRYKGHNHPIHEIHYSNGIFASVDNQGSITIWDTFDQDGIRYDNCGSAFFNPPNEHNIRLNRSRYGDTIAIIKGMSKSEKIDSLIHFRSWLDTLTQIAVKRENNYVQSALYENTEELLTFNGKVVQHWRNDGTLLREFTAYGQASSPFEVSRDDHVWITRRVRQKNAAQYQYYLIAFDWAGEIVKYFKIPAPPTAIKSYNDGKNIFIALKDKNYTLANFTTDGELLWKTIGHSGQINHIAVSPDESRIATSSADHNIKVWRSTDGVLLSRPLIHQESVRWARLGNDNIIESTDQDGCPYHWFGYSLPLHNQATIQEEK